MVKMPNIVVLFVCFCCVSVERYFAVSCSVAEAAQGQTEVANGMVTSDLKELRCRRGVR